MTHVIITASDSRYGDFLVRHWGRSLKTNVDLRDIDVVVLDYGLTAIQRQGVEALGFQIRTGKRDGHVVNVRFRDTRDWLRKSSYDQVLMIDGGDIIFQSDIRHLFEQDKQHYRAACEEVLVPAFAQYIATEDFEPAVYEEVYSFLERRRLINCGLVLGPREKMVELCDVCCDKVKSLQRAGVDQMLTNYHLYRQGFVALCLATISYSSVRDSNIRCGTANSSTPRADLFPLCTMPAWDIACSGILVLVPLAIGKIASLQLGERRGP